MKHTKGNWKIKKRKDNLFIETDEFVYESGSTLAEINVYNPQAQANARLIAAAPELLEALQTLLKEARQNSFNLTHSLSDTAAEEKAQLAINKALQP